MKIPWIFDGSPYANLILREKDIAMHPYSTKFSLAYVIKNNSSSFTKEELLFLNELIESKDKDNLIIAFTIIDGK